jgi:starch-binding outer membrane protein, SusD/RagB family
MKTYNKSILVAFLLVMFTVSCNDYLDVPVESNVTEEDVYSTYKGYQGFVDYMYTLIIDYNRHALTTTGNIGGEVIGSGTMGWTSGYKAMRGTYQEWIGNQLHSNYNASAEKNIITDNAPTGEWPDSWKGIRAANKAIANIDMLQGTEEEKNIILGQAYFFRAYFHFTLIQTWGGMPYIDVFIDSNVDISTISKRLTFQESVEKIVVDLDKAIELLPSDWDDTQPGKLTDGANLGRIIKGTAIAYKAKAYLYAGSPLQNGFSGGAFEYNKAYMEKAAKASWECIQWAEQTGKARLHPGATIQKCLHATMVALHGVMKFC